MFSFFWLFVGFLTGMIISVVFAPPMRIEPQLPTPNGNEVLHTKTGCVKFETTEVPCENTTTSLNFIASHK